MRGDLIVVYSFLRTGRREGGAEFYFLGCNDRMSGKGSKLHQERFRLGIRKQFLTERVVKPWKKIPRELADAPSLSVLKRHLVSALNSML